MMGSRQLAMNIEPITSASSRVAME
jgi:hypothetical protein